MCCWKARSQDMKNLDRKKSLQRKKGYLSNYSVALKDNIVAEHEISHQERDQISNRPVKIVQAVQAFHSRVHNHEL